MNERTCIAVEIDTFFWIEEHILSCIHLQDEVLERSHAYNSGYLLSLILGYAFEFVDFVSRKFLRICNHRGNQVVGIHHSAFPTLHLTVWKFHHSVGEMNEILAPLETQLVEQDAEDLEVIVLFVAHNINHLVDGIVLETQFGSSYVLRHIDTRTVGTEQELFVETFAGEVCPHTSIRTTIEEAFCETFLNLFLALQIRFALVINLVERDAKSLVSLVETCINPFVHLLPKTTNFRVVLLPFHKHFVSFLDERSLLLSLLFVHSLFHKLTNLVAIVLVEGYIVIANQMVTLLT